MYKAKYQIFRKDINGLRALAVSCVLLYHFKVPGFAGGFVGVDMFLVISGFLMTQILMRSIDRGDYTERPLGSIVRFYERRALRIIPALAVLSVAMLAGGWFFLLGQDYLYLTSEIVFALFFLSNMKYYWNPEGNVVGKAAGYFSDTDYTRWLLHSWSLSLEWQFYIVFPFVLWLIWRMSRKPGMFVVWVALLSVASFLINLILVHENPELAFYGLPSRAWEFAAGGLVFLLGRRISIRRVWQWIIFYCGLALICVSVFFAFDAAHWPGWGALMPVLGTALVITAERGNTWVLSNPLAQGLGLISYSLYLWHWPIIVALKYLYIPETYVSRLLGMAAAVVLASLSYILVETRVLSLRGAMRPAVAWAGIFALVTLPCGLGALARINADAPQRISAQVLEILREKDNINPRRNECHLIGVTQAPECRYGGNQLGLILTGDSHASTIARTLEASLPARNQYVLDLTTRGCPLILNANRPGKEYKCREFTDYVAKRLRELPTGIPLLIASRATYYLLGPNEEAKGIVAPLIAFEKQVPGRPIEEIYRDHQILTLCEFAKQRPVYVLNPIPELKVSVPQYVARRTMAGLSSEITISTEEYVRRHNFVREVQRQAAASCGVKLLDPVPYLCSEGLCRGTRNGRPLYTDDDHLSESGAQLLFPLFKQIDSAEATTNAPASLEKTE